MPDVGRYDNRAARKARAERAAQRTPLPPEGSRGIGNPAAEAIKKYLEELREESS